MKFQLILTAAGAVAALACASPAFAQSESYRIDANSSSTISLNICSPQVRLSVHGDGDTDLDFTVTDSSGNIVHSDYDTTDITYATLNRRSDVQCENFDLEIQNLGDVYNMAEVTLETLSSGGSSGGSTRSYRANSDSTSRIGLEICGPATRVQVRGDGDTDLDFRIYDPSGNEVASDYATTDTMDTVISPSGSGCATYSMEVVNLGDVYNMYTVTLSSSGAVLGSQDGKNRNVSIHNETGDTITYLYWSNTGATGWGDDRLGSGVLANGQNWNVTVDDASGACMFDFKAKLSGGREIERRGINVCSTYVITFD